MPINEDLPYMEIDLLRKYKSLILHYYKNPKTLKK